jgi:hypothetical protein
MKQYLIFRESAKCQLCKKYKSKDSWNIHHLVPKKDGGTDTPDNLALLHSECHEKLHNNNLDEEIEQKTKNLINNGSKNFKYTTFMNIIKNKLYRDLSNIYNDKVNFTYGYITNINRRQLGLSKTHYNDAFAIVKGINQVRNSKIFEVKQVRRNNRSLEKFYDAKYIDIRTGEKVSGGDLNNGRRTRNKNLNSENLHQYRGKKLSEGQRRIRKVKYFYQPNDLIKYEGKIYSVKGTQNGGAYIRLNEIKKVPRSDLLTPYKFMKGFVYGLYIKESQQILDNGTLNICL